MPGGWVMSMAWLPICGQRRIDGAVCFLGMWMVMMVAMMFPSLLPMLRRYREAVGGTGAAHVGRLTMLASAGYFLVWSTFGIAAYLVGVGFVEAETRMPALAREAPLATGLALLFAGALQLSTWKAGHLACCRKPPHHGRALQGNDGAAWRYGLRLGLHCGSCCAPLTVTLLVLGVMDLGVMAIVTGAITAERLAPSGERVARAIGATLIGAGLFLIASAPGR